MNQNNNSGIFFKSAAFGVLAGYISSVLLMLIFSLILTAADMGSSAATVFSLVTLGASSFICGFVASKLLGSRALIISAAAGAAYYLTLAVISAAVTGGGFTKMFFVKLAIALVLSIAGGIVSTFRKSSKTVV